MRTAVALAVFCAILALSEGAAVKTRRSSQSVQQCQIAKVVEMVAEIVADSYALKADVAETYESTLEGMVKCVATSFTTLATCVTDTVQTGITTLEGDVTTYVSNVKSLITDIQQDLEECV